MTGAQLDKWLWYARLARTRSLAAKLCADGDVTLAGAVALKPGLTVRVGDVVTVRRGRWSRRVTVLALGERRGSATEARLLYAEPEPPLVLDAGERRDWVNLIDETSAGE